MNGINIDEQIIYSVWNSVDNSVWDSVYRSVRSSAYISVNKTIQKYEWK
jgi:hypothetical protein